MKYLVAFAGRPKPNFVAEVVRLAALDGVEILGALVVPGPGCYNLAYEVEGENERFANTLTMALMPAQWSTTADDVPRGHFTELPA